MVKVPRLSSGESGINTRQATIYGAMVEWLRRFPVTEETEGSSPVGVAIYNTPEYLSGREGA